MELYYSLKVLHVAVASVWIGAGLLGPQDVRDSLLAGSSQVPALLGRLKKIARVMNTSALLTVVTGFALIFAGGGFAGTPMRINIGIGLTFLAYAAGRWMIRPAIMAIAGSAKRELSKQEASAMADTFARAVNTEHVLRFAVLVLMIYPFAF